MKNIILALALLLVPASAFAGDKDHKDMHKEMMEKADADHDGKISKDEFLKEKEEWFTKYDANKDGKLEKSEMDTMMGEHKKKCDEHHKEH